MIDQINGVWIAVNLYRSSANGSFDPEDLSSLRDLASTVLALSGRHAALRHPRVPLPQVAEKDSLYAALLGGSLSLRERAVCIRALQGQSVKRMAAELGVQPTTIATLRRRAFQKLDVRNTIELFVKCLGALTPSQNHAERLTR